MSTGLLMELAAFEAEYWRDVDHNWGRLAHTFYCDDGRFIIGDKRMNGPGGVAEFYTWRQGRGERTARHLISNFTLFSKADDKATLECVMCLYAADGSPVLESRPAIMMADVTSECVRQANSKWQYVLHQLTPIFMGGVPPTMPPEN
jgi:hypothetical protein